MGGGGGQGEPRGLLPREERRRGRWLVREGEVGGEGGRGDYLREGVRRKMEGRRGGGEEGRRGGGRGGGEEGGGEEGGREA